MKVKIGDRILYDQWVDGKDTPTEAMVTGLKVVPEGCKLGREVRTATLPRRDTMDVIVSLDNGHWTRSGDVRRVVARAEPGYCTETTVTMRINWTLFRKQKLIILKAMDGKPLTENERGDLNGVLEVFDAIQDNAVDNEGLTDRDVFGPKFGKC